VDLTFSHRYWKYGNTNRADDINNIDNDWFRGDNLYELFTKENHDKSVYFTVAPWERLKADDSKERRFTNLGNIYLNLTPVKGLLLRTQLSGQLEFRKAHLYESPNNFNSVEIEGRKGYAKFENVLQTNYSVDQLVSYNFGLVGNRLSIGLIGGVSYYDYYISTQQIAGTEIPNLSSISISDIGNPTQTSGADRRWRMLSFFGKFSLDWEKKYTLAAAFRSDASSKFPTKNQVGYFPTVSVAWNAKNESFLRNEDLVSQLKLRASFGYSGNQEGILSEASQDNFYFTNPEFNYQGSGVGEFYSYKYNPDLKWEQVQNINAGLDFGLFQDRFTMSVDWYHKTTFGAIGLMPLDLATGYTGMRANIADIRNTGVEALVSGTPVLTKNITWRIYANASANQNKILKINNGTGEIRGSWKIQKEGYEMGTTIIKYTDGELDQAGVEIIKEKYVQGAFPKFEGGLGTSLNLYGVDINIFANYKYGNKIFSRVHDISRDQTEEFLRDGSYLRLKDLTVGYTLPVNISRKAKIESIRLYVQLTNMLTLKADKWLADPETQTIRENTSSTALGYDYGAVPNARAVNIGLSLKI
jgi:outer membrane receptor protein involved in Fe transport